MPSKSRKQHPVSTAAISLPQVQDATAPTSLAHFSPNADLFALLSLAVDKHRLRVFDTATQSVLAEHTIDAARVTCLSWVLLDLSSDAVRTNVSPIKKRKITASTLSSDTPPIKVHLVCMGLSNGSISLFSTTHARVLRTISHPSSLASILATSADTQPSRIWSSSADGVVRLWDASRNDLLGSWKNEGTVPYSCIASRPGQKHELGTELLVANHAMRLLSFPTSTPSMMEPEKPVEKGLFTGHASAVTHLQWDQSEPSRFISAAEADRVVNVWRVPDPSSKHGTIVANIPLDAFARQVILSSSNTPTLLIVSASGKLALFKLPPLPTRSEKVATLSSCSTISVSSKKGRDDVHIVAATFVPHDHGRLRVARLKGGVKPVFEVVSYLDDVGNFIPQVLLSKDTSSGLITMADGGPRISQTRYVEAPDLAVRSGFEPAQTSDTEDMPAKGADGDLDVDLAELSLGQRLAALSGEASLSANASSASENDVASPPKQSNGRRSQKSRKGKEHNSDNLGVPAHSLSRTLVQALHSADTRLLEMCLRHSDETLVLNTVRRLPPQLVVPLLTACVERLARGAGGNTGKGGGGGASAQRGTGLIRWIRAVLVVHTAHLMTIPDLVSRLSTLHATLMARLSLRDPLLALNGRLQLVLSQIELRASAGPSPLAPELKTSNQGGKRGPFKYVEGESESEDEVGDGDVDEMDAERDDDAGSIEEVELGADSASDEVEESGRETEAQNGEDEESDEGPRLNGFIDDEAEEWSEEDDDEEDLEE